ncbi:hypothetical protein BJ165DRAFT_1454106 [Panaeolus papilionaceus]|nr:hypothetical protein BJ165DRAFT_1454106 [Panaeolus papilionaceus]
MYCHVAYYITSLPVALFIFKQVQRLFNHISAVYNPRLLLLLIYVIISTINTAGACVEQILKSHQHTSPCCRRRS